MIEQRTLQIDGNIVYCYSDGSVEWNTYTKDNRLYHCHTFGCSRGKKNYLCITIKGKHYAVHRLIALAFHNQVDGSFEVDHIDRNKQNNCAKNLRWASRLLNESNKDSVDTAISRFGVRRCENLKAYTTERCKHTVRYLKPDGTRSSTGYLIDAELALLKPMMVTNRYFAYQDILLKRKEAV